MSQVLEPSANPVPFIYKAIQILKYTDLALMTLNTTLHAKASAATYQLCLWQGALLQSSHRWGQRDWIANLIGRQIAGNFVRLGVVWPDTIAASAVSRQLFLFDY
jgi:hypothetical protein